MRTVRQGYFGCYSYWIRKNLRKTIDSTTDASVDEIIDCACMMGPSVPCPLWFDLYVYYFLEDKEDELVWRILHGSEDIAYGAAHYLAWKYNLQKLFIEEFDLAKARERLDQLGWFD